MSRKQITIIGLGLIGGSLAKALKKKKNAYTVHGYARSEATVQKAEKADVIAKGFTSIATAVKNSDMIIFCTPLSSYASLLQEALPHLKKDAIISDAGSAKEYVSDTLLPLLSEEQRKYCVPAHPIAGAEKSGFTASKQSLYKGKRVIVTPTPYSIPSAIDAIKQLWQHTGANVEEIAAKRHDAIYATVSHTPQLLAFAYNHALNALSEDVQTHITAHENESFTRFRRIGNSPTEMWDDIFAANHTAISHAVDKVTDALALSAKHFDERAQDFARNHASMNILEHSPLSDEISHEAFVHLYVLPVMLARALHSVAELYLPYAGTGFADFTNMQQIPLPAHEIPPLKRATLAALARLKETIASFRAGL